MQSLCPNPTTHPGTRPSATIRASSKLSNWACPRWTLHQNFPSTKASTGEKSVHLKEWTFQELDFPMWFTLQGSDPLWRLWECAARNQIQASRAGPELSQVPGAPGSGNEETHFQQKRPGMDIWGHPPHPAHNHYRVHPGPRVGRPVRRSRGCHIGFPPHNGRRNVSLNCPSDD